MKIVMLSGSPKRKDSASIYLLEQLKKRMPDDEITLLRTDDLIHKIGDTDEMKNTDKIGDIDKTDALILSFPLYVDGIPSNVLAFMQETEQEWKNHNHKTMLYIVVNNGFYDAKQNKIAAGMTEVWGEACGLQIGNVLAVGGGGMMKSAPPGVGPMANLGKALNQFIDDIHEKKQGEVTLVEPNFPRFLYKEAGNMGWRHQAKANGLPVSEMKRKL